MTYHNIFVAVSGGSASQGALDLAARLARQHGAHLEGFHVRADARDIALAYGDGFGTPVVGDLMERTAQEVADTAARAKQMFDKAIASQSLPMRTDPPTPKPGSKAAREATASWREETGFAGSDAVAAARAEGTAERLAAFAITGRGIPRQGNPILVGEDRVGTVTSGTFSPSLGFGIGMGYVRSDLAEPGTAVAIDVRGRRREAEIRSKPLYAGN